MMKFKRFYFFGGEKKDKTTDDWVEKYVAENGVEIKVLHGFSSLSYTWYETLGKTFETLKEAKQYVIDCEK